MVTGTGTRAPRPLRPLAGRLRSAQTVTTLAFLVAGLAWGGFLGWQHLGGAASILDRLEAVALDVRFHLAGARPAPTEVVVVAIDDETLERAGQVPSLPRAEIAKLVVALAEHEPKAVALDLLFLDARPQEGDQALAAALARTRSVIAAGALFGNRTAPATRPTVLPTGETAAAVPTPTMVLWPHETFREAAPAGLVNLSTDAGGTPRHVPLVFQLEEGIGLSFPFMTALAAFEADPTVSAEGIRLGPHRFRTDLGHHLPIRYYGPSGAIRTVSAGRVLRGEVPAGELKGRILVLGMTAIASSDEFPTPFDPRMAGVEVLATAVANLVSGEGLTRDFQVRRIDAAAALVLPCALVLLMAMRRIALGIVLTAALTVLWLTFTFVGFLHGIWYSVTVPLAAALPIAAAFGGTSLWLDRRLVGRLSTVSSEFQRFQPAPLIERLSEDPTFLAEPVEQMAGILFVDLSGFTGLSEILGPKASQRFLKTFHGRIEEAVSNEGGFVVDFMGDGAMCLFGCPDPHPDDAARTGHAALTLCQSLEAWLRMEALPRGAARPRSRIGAHFGPVVISRLGSERHEQITATGDTVNVASRLMEVAARFGAAAALSEEVAEAAGQAGFEGTSLQLGEPFETSIRGRAKPLRIRLVTRPTLAGLRGRGGEAA